MTTIPVDRWKSYEIHERGDDGEIRAGPCVIVAPSPGVAIEYFLAIHGMMGYKDIFVRGGRDAVPDETAAQVLAIMPNASELVAEYDAHHRWQWLPQEEQTI